MLGTLRALSKQTREAVRAQIIQVAEGVAAAHGASVQVEIETGYPMTVNDPAAAEVARVVAAELIGEDTVTVLSEPIMGAEDFSYVLQRVPGAMAFLGACPPDLDPEAAPSNHSSKVIFDEDALPVGVATYAALALRELNGSAAG
jgi:hippurate hydrolase